MTKQTIGPAFDNQCSMCNHIKNPDEGHCYMFRNAPIGPCAQQTVATIKNLNSRALAAIATLERLRLASKGMLRNYD